MTLTSSIQRGPAKSGTAQSIEAAGLPDALLKLATVVQATGLSRATIYRRIANGTFPQPVRVGAKSARWPAAQVRAWIAAIAGGADA